MQIPFKSQITINLSYSYFFLIQICHENKIWLLILYFLFTHGNFLVLETKSKLIKFINLKLINLKPSLQRIINIIEHFYLLPVSCKKLWRSFKKVRLSKVELIHNSKKVTITEVTILPTWIHFQSSIFQAKKIISYITMLWTQESTSCTAVWFCQEKETWRTTIPRNAWRVSVGQSKDFQMGIVDLGVCKKPRSPHRELQTSEL